jgi:cell wall-associated NlpC family hydrolase
MKGEFMKTVKQTKKTLLVLLILLLVTSMMMTAAIADEYDFTGTPTADDYPAAAVTDTITPEPPQSPAPAVDPTQVDIPEAGVFTDPHELAAYIPVTPAETADESDAGDASPPPLPDGEAMVDMMNAAGRTIADFALQYDGFRYRYGAASPKSGFDCSGLVYYVYTHFGYTIPRTARAQYKNGAAVEKPDLKPGDLVFFSGNGGRSITHVGIYIGDDQFIHASTWRYGVKINSLVGSYWEKALYGARRLITAQSVLELFSPPEGTESV